MKEQDTSGVGMRTWHQRRGGSRFVLSGLLVAMTSFGLGQTGVSAIEFSSPVAAGNGGIANTEGDASVTTGDIITGLNSGSNVSIGDVHADTVSVEIAELSNDTDQDFVAAVGPQSSDASGAADATALGGQPGQPIDIVVDVNTDVDADTDVRNDNDNRNENENANANANENDNSNENNIDIASLLE